MFVSFQCNCMRCSIYARWPASLLLLSSVSSTSFVLFLSFVILSRSWFISVGWLTYREKAMLWRVSNWYRKMLFCVVRWYRSGALLEESRYHVATYRCSIDSNVYYTTISGLWRLVDDEIWTLEVGAFVMVDGRAGTSLLHVMLSVQTIKILNLRRNFLQSSENIKY